MKTHHGLEIEEHPLMRRLRSSGGEARQPDYWLADWLPQSIDSWLHILR